MVDKIWYNMEELIGGSEERVLIETYWNVKELMGDMTDRNTEGINRNILECKDLILDNAPVTAPVLIETYWNVKARLCWSHWKEFMVLIETYWNVKVIEHILDLTYL